MKFVTYTGTEDHRILSSPSDLPPEVDGEGNIVEEDPDAEPEELKWSRNRAHVLVLEDGVADRVLRVGGFRESTDEEAQAHIQALEEERDWLKAEEYRNLRSIGMIDESESSQSPEGVEGSTDDADEVDDQASNPDASGTDPDRIETGESGDAVAAPPTNVGTSPTPTGGSTGSTTRARGSRTK